MHTDDKKQVEKTHVSPQLWFDDFISSIKVDQVLHQTDLMDPAKKHIYDAMIADNQDVVFNSAMQMASTHFIMKLVEKYFIELFSDKKHIPSRLAFDLSDSKILVWAEIENDDEQAEDKLILAAAKVNSLFFDYGFHLSSTIVEKSDGLAIPKQYKEVELKN